MSVWCGLEEPCLCPESPMGPHCLESSLGEAQGPTDGTGQERSPQAPLHAPKTRENFKAFFPFSVQAPWETDSSGVLLTGKLAEIRTRQHSLEWPRVAADAS